MTTHESNPNSTPANVKREAKRKSTTLTAGGDSLTILALRRPSGDSTVFVQTTNTKTKKTQRGMTQDFSTFEEACNGVERLAEEAIKKGWTRKERSGGFKARPDAFSSIPTAPTKGKK
jgi:hypothetical protein